MENYRNTQVNKDEISSFNEVIFIHDMQVLFAESSNALVDMNDVNRVYDEWNAKYEHLNPKKEHKSSFMDKVNGAWVVVKEKLIEFLKKIWGYIVQAYQFILKIIDKIKDPKAQLKRDIQSITDNMVTTLIHTLLAKDYIKKDKAPAPAFRDFVMNRAVAASLYDIVILYSMKDRGGLSYICNDFLREIEGLQYENSKENILRLYFDKLKILLIDIEKLIDNNETDINKIKNTESYKELYDIFYRIKSDFSKTVKVSGVNPKDIIETPWSVKANIPENWDDILGFLVHRKIDKVEEIINNYSTKCIYVKKLYSDILMEVANETTPKERSYAKLKEYIQEVATITNTVKVRFDIWLKDMTNAHMKNETNIMKSYASISQTILGQLFYIGQIAKTSVEDIQTIEIATTEIIKRFSTTYKILFYVDKGLVKTIDGIEKVKEKFSKKR